MADRKPILFYVAEDDTSYVKGDTEDGAYDKFREENGAYPLRVLAITKDSDGQSGMEGYVVWEDWESDDEEDEGDDE